MTREEAIKILKNKMDGKTDTSYEWCECIRMAIEALEQIGKIKTIIDSGVYIQEDVLRYKMICEVVEK